MDISATQGHIFKASKMVQQVRAQIAEPSVPISVPHIHKHRRELMPTSCHVTSRWEAGLTRDQWGLCTLTRLVW